MFCCLCTGKMRIDATQMPFAAVKRFANIAQYFYKSNKKQEKVMNMIKKSALKPLFIAFHGYF